MRIGILQIIISAVPVGVMKAKVLLLHHNFPAQFRFVALDLARAGHDIVFLSERNLTGELAGVRQITVAERQLNSSSSIEGQLDCSTRFREAMELLREQGWT